MIAHFRRSFGHDSVDPGVILGNGDEDVRNARSATQLGAIRTDAHQEWIRGIGLINQGSAGIALNC